MSSIDFWDFGNGSLNTGLLGFSGLLPLAPRGSLLIIIDNLSVSENYHNGNLVFTFA